MSHIISSEYARLDSRDVLVDASPRITARIREYVPSWRDMHMEMQRWTRHAVDGVEFIQRERKPSRGVWLARDPDKRHERRKQYGQVMLPFEEAHNDDLGPDVVRHRVFRLVEMMAVAVAAEVLALRSDPSEAMTIRSTPGQLPRFMDTYGDDVGGRVLTSLYTDEIVLRFAAYYFIAPTGEEMEFPDE